MCVHLCGSLTSKQGRSSASWEALLFQGREEVPAVSTCSGMQQGEPCPWPLCLPLLTWGPQ